MPKHFLAALVCGVGGEVCLTEELPSWEPSAVATDRKTEVRIRRDEGRGGLLLSVLHNSIYSHKVTGVRQVIS